MPPHFVNKMPHYYFVQCVIFITFGNILETPINERYKS